MEDLTTIKLHGVLADQVGVDVWNLKVSSVSEALRAIDTMCQRKLTLAIVHNEKQHIKYQVLVDEKNLFSESIETAEQVKSSELFLQKKMKRIDIVPVIEGAGDDFKDMAMILGGALMFGMGWGMGSPGLMQLGLYTLLLGLSNLLSEPPEFEDFREMEQITKKESYLYNGVQNTYNPGGPVPIGYGRMLVGSLLVGYAHHTTDKKIFDNGTHYP
jgi:predicted phage tail protein